jgi:hypothetical protein
MGTAMIFTCFSLSALYARRRSYLFLGGMDWKQAPGSALALRAVGRVFYLRSLGARVK